MKITFKENAAARSRHSAPDIHEEDDSKCVGGIAGTAVPVPRSSHCSTQSVAEREDFYGGVRSSCIEGPGIYYFGLIDMMQKYSWKKHVETWWKGSVLGQGEGISCVEPHLYRRRFMKYMQSIIISDHQYYAELNLKREKFGDERVMIFPPQKVLRKNIKDLCHRRRSVYPSLDQRSVIPRLSTYSKGGASVAAAHSYNGTYNAENGFTRTPRTPHTELQIRAIAWEEQSTD